MNTLWSQCETVYFPRKLTMRSQKTRNAYKYAIDDFGEFLGHIPTIEDLDDDALTLWASALLDGPLSVHTSREKLGRIISLWNWLARRGVVKTFPTIQRPPAPETLPKAWDKDELRRLFDAAQWEDGWISGVPARKWWPALFSFAWSTAERRGACLAMEWKHVDLERGVASIPASVRKGKRKPAVYHLWPEVVEMLRAIRAPERERVFPWEFSEGCYFYRFGRILKRAGLPNDRKSKTHCLRVSHATWRAIAGGDASKALMHSDPETTRKSYLDSRLIPTVEERLFTPWG